MDNEVLETILVLAVTGAIGFVLYHVHLRHLARKRKRRDERER